MVKDGDRIFVNVYGIDKDIGQDCQQAEPAQREGDGRV